MIKSSVEEKTTTDLMSFCKYLQDHFYYYLAKFGTKQMELNVNINNNIMYYLEISLSNNAFFIRFEQTDKNLSCILNIRRFAEQMAIDLDMSQLFLNAIKKVME